MLPSVLKKFNLYIDGENYIGRIAELTLPKISHVMEDYRGGGMLGPIKQEYGLEALEMEMTIGGHEAHIIRQLGASQHDAVMLRFVGSYQRDDTGEVSVAEIFVRGRHQELDRGNAKSGEKTEYKVKTAISYYEEWIDGQPLLRINMETGEYIVDGIDRYAAINAAFN